MKKKSNGAPSVIPSTYLNDHLDETAYRVKEGVSDADMRIF